MAGWRVEYDEAFDAWVDHARPSLNDENDMLLEFDAWEREGPPTHTDFYPPWNYVTDGPHGERVVFRTEAAPNQDPAGYLYVVTIGQARAPGRP